MNSNSFYYHITLAKPPHRATDKFNLFGLYLYTKYILSWYATQLKLNSMFHLKLACTNTSTNIVLIHIKQVAHDCATCCLSLLECCLFNFRLSQDFSLRHL